MMVMVLVMLAVLIMVIHDIGDDHVADDDSGDGK